MDKNLNRLLQTMAGAVLTISLSAGAQTPVPPVPAAAPAATAAHTSDAAPLTNEEILKELAAMNARIAQLEAELKARTEANAERDASALRTAAVAAASGKGDSTTPAAQAQTAAAAPAEGADDRDLRNVEGSAERGEEGDPPGARKATAIAIREIA